MLHILKMNYREYTCIKHHNSNIYKVYSGIMYLSEAQTFEDYVIVKVPIVEVYGIESLYYGIFYDKQFIKERLQTNRIRFV
jgi:hypothetical protein